MDSISRPNQMFHILFGVILLIHAALLSTSIKNNFQNSLESIPKAIKLKLVQEAVSEMINSQKKQIVQSEDSLNNEKKKDAFLSDKDRSFDRETVSRNVDTFKSASLGNATVTQKRQSNVSKSKEKTNLKDLKLSDVGFEVSAPRPDKLAHTPEANSIKGMKNGNPLDQGLSATNDYMEEVTLGDFTHLNTVEYKFYGFFHRIRQKLEQFWGKSIQEKAEALFKSGRRLPASENLITSLQVTLNEKGEIIAVKILGASGVRELDDAAIDSFNQAGPFPNPPKELLINGKATIDWGFVVKS